VEEAKFRVPQFAREGTADDAAANLPLIFQLMGEHPDITVQQAEKYVPPFDDIFVKLMEQAGDEHV
jgi:hypothetical protein